MRPTKVYCELPANDIIALEQIHFYPDIDSDTNERAKVDEQGKIRYSRYPHEFKFNQCFEFNLQGTITDSGWR